MLKRVLLLVLVFSVQSSYAALHPKYQNMKDLKVMVGFIESHEKVLVTLEGIDFKNFTIHYNHGCKVIFGRRYAPKPAGWAGPADPLEFKKSTCEIK